MSFNTDTEGMSYALSILGVKGNPDLPIVDTTRVLGGNWSLPSLFLRDSIPATLRKSNVTRCYVEQEDVTYVLRNGIGNEHWIVADSDGRDGIDAPQLLALIADQVVPVGQAYSLTLPALYGASFAPFKASNLPPGLTLASGAIVGAPTAAGSWISLIDYFNSTTSRYTQYSILFTATVVSVPATTVGAANIDLIWNPIANDPFAPGNQVNYDYDLALQLTETGMAETGQRAIPSVSDARYIGAKSIPGAIALAALGSSIGGTTQQRFVRFAISLAVLRSLYPAKTTVVFGVYAKRKANNPTDTPNNKISAVTINRTKTSGIVGKTAANSVDFTTVGDALAPATTSTGWLVGVTESLLFTITANLTTGELVIGTVIVPNVAPTVANPAPDSSGTVGLAFTQTLPTNEFADSDGTIVSWAASGLPAGLTFNATTRVISGTPTIAGTFGVTITATDNQGATVSDSLIIAVAPANVAPTVANPAPDSSGMVGVAFSQTLPINEFADSDGTIVSWAASGLPAGLTYNATTRVISGTPTTAGTATVTITATDDKGATVADTIVITIAPAANIPPTVTNPAPDSSGTVGVAFSQTLPANQFTDSDGTIVLVAAAGLPPGLGFTAVSRIISGTPSTPGSYTVNVTATDDRGGSVTDTLIITIASAPVQANVAPTVTNPAPDSSGTVGVAFSQTLPANQFTDSDGTIQGLSIAGYPPGVTYDIATRTLSGTPTTAGTYNVSVTAVDNQGASVSDAFVITIAPAPTPTTFSRDGQDFIA